MVPWLILCLAGVHQLAGDATKMYVSWKDLMVVSIGIPPNHFSDYFSMVLINLFFLGGWVPRIFGNYSLLLGRSNYRFRAHWTSKETIEGPFCWKQLILSTEIHLTLPHYFVVAFSARDFLSLSPWRSKFIPPTEREKTPRPSQPFVSQPFSDLGDRPFHKHLVPWYLGLHFFERTTERPHFEWSNTRVSCEIWVTFERKKKKIGSFEW